ncbi:MAG: hypothetical protein SGPRY_002619 [Prymnesium sp.]
MPSRAYSPALSTLSRAKQYLLAQRQAPRVTSCVAFRTHLMATPSRWGSGCAAGKTVMIPNMGDSISEGTILSLMKKEGDYVAAEEVVAEVETDKVTVEARSPDAGTITAIHVEEGATVEVGAPFFSLDVGVGSPVENAPSPAPVSDSKPKEEASPAKQGKEAAKPPSPSTTQAPSQAPSPAPASDDHPARETRVAMTRLRKKIAARLKDSQNTAAMLTTFNEVDMKPLTDLRNEYKASRSLHLALNRPPISGLCYRTLSPRSTALNSASCRHSSLLVLLLSRCASPAPACSPFLTR